MAQATSNRNFFTTIFTSPSELRELANLIESGNGLAFSEKCLIKEHGSHHVEEKEVFFINPKKYKNNCSYWNICDYKLSKIGNYHFLYDLGIGNNRIQNCTNKIQTHYKILYPKTLDRIMIFLKDIDQNWYTLFFNTGKTPPTIKKLNVQTNSEFDVIEYFKNNYLANEK